MLDIQQFSFEQIRSRASIMFQQLAKQLRLPSQHLSVQYQQWPYQKRGKISLNLTTKTSEQRQNCSSVSIVNSEEISYITHISYVSVVVSKQTYLFTGVDPHVWLWTFWYENSTRIKKKKIKFTLFVSHLTLNCSGKLKSAGAKFSLLAM